MHNYNCTHGGAHAPSECRDRFGTRLQPLEGAKFDPTPQLARQDGEAAPAATVDDPVEPQALTDADRVALRRALAGLTTPTE